MEMRAMPSDTNPTKFNMLRRVKVKYLECPEPSNASSYEAQRVAPLAVTVPV
jgi:hypothetical protein